MEMQQNMAGEMPKKDKKKFIAGAAAVALLALLVLALWWQSSRTPISIEQPADSAAAINEEVESLDIGNLDAEFEAIDQELGQL